MAGVVLLSGGLDSTVAMALFLEQNTLDLALTFDYGQRARERELQAAASLAECYGINHKVIKLPFLEEETHTALVDSTQSLPSLKPTELDEVQGRAAVSAHNVWVPNRNGLFINIAAVFAENLPEPSYIIAGFNREEAGTFPDNSPAFIETINASLAYSTSKNIILFSPTSLLDKTEIVKEGLRLHIPWQFLWSCYAGRELWCGACESCQRLKRALSLNGQEDLIEKLFAQQSELD
ncbi:7-cyano-7-deazaguanine synthase QueC [Paradesulfitobacterium aromaticivorans]